MARPEETFKVGVNGLWWGPIEHHLWAEDGRYGLLKAATLEEATEYIGRWEIDLEFSCAVCGEWFPHTEIAFQRFAGNYCQPCGDVFKEKNSRRCSLCGRPIYNCYC